MMTPFPARQAYGYAPRSWHSLSLWNMGVSKRGGPRTSEDSPYILKDRRRMKSGRLHENVNGDSPAERIGTAGVMPLQEGVLLSWVLTIVRCAGRSRVPKYRPF